jgi:hypothetical protein
METVSIRDLRGAALRERTAGGEPLAITNHRVLIGVVIPVSPAWVEHLVYQNWQQVSQAIAGSEKDLAGGTPMTTLAELVSAPLTAAVVDGDVLQTQESAETVARWRAALNPAASADEQGTEQAAPSRVRAVRIGDLSARVIEDAGRAGETLAITHDRELIGIVVPVTQDLVQFLIEKNLSRVLSNIDLAEKQLGTRDGMTPLDQEVRPERP